MAASIFILPFFFFPCLPVRLDLIFGRQREFYLVCVCFQKSSVKNTEEQVGLGKKFKIREMKEHLDLNR